MNFGKKTRGPAKISQHQTCAKRQFTEECHATLSFLGLYDYVATKLKAYNKDVGKLKTFRLLEEDEHPFTDKKEKATKTNTM